MTSQTLPPATRWSSIVAAWVLAAIAVVCVALFSSPELYPEWLTLSLGGAVVAALAIQLATREKNGFVNRLMLSVVGALLVVAIAAFVLWILAL